MPIEGRPRAYADENFDARVIEALRRRGFDVLTARDVGMLGADDQAQLTYAAATGRVLLTFDRRDFRRLHAQRQQEAEPHAGIALVPQSRVWERTAIRAAMLLDWLGALESDPAPLVAWNDLQARLHRGERPMGYSEDELRVALGYGV